MRRLRPRVHIYATYDLVCGTLGLVPSHSMPPSGPGVELVPERHSARAPYVLAPRLGSCIFSVYYTFTMIAFHHVAPLILRVPQRPLASDATTAVSTTVRLCSSSRSPPRSRTRPRLRLYSIVTPTLRHSTFHTVVHDLYMYVGGQLGQGGARG